MKENHTQYSKNIGFVDFIKTLFSKNGITPYLIVTFISICTFKMLMIRHWPHIDLLTSAALGVTEGKPHWLAYQNRLLGPYSILGLSNLIGISFKTAWTIFHAITIQIFCILCFWIFKREGLRISYAINYLIVFLFAFLSLQFNWFFPWDTIDLILFTCFAYGIAKSFPIPYFLAIFVIGIFNRESALLIAIYLMLDAFTLVKGNFSIQFTKPKSFLTGISILPIGIIYTKYIRELLFISKPDGLPDIKHELIGNHIYFLRNLKELFFYNFTNINFLVSIFLIVSFGYFLGNFLRMNDCQLKLLIMSLIIFLNIIIFGILNETRMYFIILPFFLFLWMSMNIKVRDFLSSSS
tara:strand:- start:435 stop:1490 length:1056 start_codon:yes stop_codon:yes gene_type:complete